MTDTAESAPFVRVFGGMGVDDGDGPVSIGGPKQRRLLALLVVRSGSVVSLDWLAEHLWDDDERPQPPTVALRTYVSRLRRSLPASAQNWIETEPSGYRFSAPPEAVEHQRFAMLRAGATRARGLDDPLTAQTLLDEALALWRGEPFRELEDLDWARADIEQLQMDRLEMMEERWEAVLALGRHTQITGELAAFTAEHGLRDRAARQYALALHRSGRTTEALRVIEEHRRTLAEESGLDPSPEIVELERSLLSGDSSLAVEKSGRPLRGYRLLEEIGSGAFSIVWRGVQPSVNREVAIKQIRSELASQPDFIRRFEAEAQLVARIEHPHIVPMIDFWRDPDSAYLVMRWLRGGTLERRLDDGPMTLDETMTLARQIGGALSAAHARGVVHRDVKAANILFDEQGHAFLTDFGIALDALDSGGSEAALSQGSPAYASPEQIRREPLGPRADIFSLGVVVFECLAGSLPFRDSSSLDDLVERQLHVPFPRLSEWRADLPLSVVDAVATATAKDPGARFTSVQELLDALESDTGAERPAAVRDPVSGLLDNPYKGLRAFDDGDADEFFGRERLVAEMVDRLSGHEVSSRCLVVVGPSGSGKSSVVRAGLVPALRAGAVDGSADWFSSVMVPGTDPYESLEAALLRIAVNPPPSLLGQLRDGDRGVLRGIRRCLGRDDDRVLVVIDQFEELFIGKSNDDAGAFLDALAVAVEDPTSPLRLVVTLRADYYHRPLEHPAFARVLKHSSVDVTPLAGDELERAIVEPAARLGIDFEPGLVPRIAGDTLGQPSPLPLLQYTLSELFERRAGAQLTVGAYDELGGLSGALTTRAERLYHEGDDAQRAAVRRLFGRMTNPTEEFTDLRRRVPLADLGDDPSTAWVIEHFGAARLLTFDRDVATREPTVEVAHEALLREWPRLVDWLAEDLDVLRRVHAVGLAATTWDQGGCLDADLYRGGRLETAVDVRITAPDRLRELDVEFINASRAAAEAEHAAAQRGVRRLRRLVVGVGVALVLALLAGGLALRQQRRADDEAQRAQLAAGEAEAQAVLAREQAALAAEQTRVAEEQTEAAVAAAEQAEVATIISRSAALIAEDPTISILLALEAHHRSPGPETEQAVLNALGSSTSPKRLANIPLSFERRCRGGRISRDGQVAFAVSQGYLVAGDIATGVFDGTIETPASCVDWSHDERADRTWAVTRDGRRLWLGPYGGPWELEKEFDQPTFVVGAALTAAQHLVAHSETLDGIVIGLLDARTGEWIAPPLAGGDDFIHGSISPDGTVAAVSVGRAGGPQGDGVLIVLDGATGAERFRIESPAPVSLTDWDPTTNELLAAMLDGRLMTVDLETGEVVSEVASTTTSVFLDLAVRPDGLITAVSEAQVEVLDRRTGPVGIPFRLRNATNAWVRADGTLLTLTSDDRGELYDLDSRPLVGPVLDVDPFSSFAFNAGIAAGVRERTRTIETVDLATGERSNPELSTRSGDPFDAVDISPETDGMWAVSEDMVIARWEGDEQVERLDLGGATVTATRYLDWWAIMSDRVDGRMVDLVNLERGATAVVFRVAAPDGSATHPTRDGGVHVIDGDGLVSTYDRTGTLVGEVETRGGEFSTSGINVEIVSLDPATGKLALAGRPGGALLVDPATGEIERLPVSDALTNLGWARNGELLAITSSDGTVRLWDVERSASAGVVWTGSGAVSGSPPWYDEATQTLWVSSSGKLVQIPLDPARWLELACEAAGRNFTQEEWDRLVPGDELLWFTCLDQVGGRSFF